MKLIHRQNQDTNNYNRGKCHLNGSTGYPYFKGGGKNTNGIIFICKSPTTLSQNQRDSDQLLKLRIEFVEVLLYIISRSDRKRQFIEEILMAITFQKKLN